MDKLTKKQKPSTATHSGGSLQPTSPPFTESQPTPASVTQSYQKPALKENQYRAKKLPYVTMSVIQL
jgi:hypothetical protein